jgi:two-component system phosphate regulon sensor histidine kinase PhoR
MLAVLVPTVLMIAVGIVLLAVGDDTGAIVAAVLILTLCTTGVTGYILGSIFVGKGASLVQVQNDFLSSVSHELRTPLTSMRLFMESLRTGRLPAEDNQRVVELLSRELDRLDGLVGRLLELSKLESGRHAFARRRVDVAELLTEAISVFDAATLGLPTPVTTHIEPDLALVGDRSTLSRAIANLLINAWKYSEADKRIVLSARNHGRWIEVTVEDNGIGIARHEQGEVFEEFARGKAAIDRGTPGVGLGLAFVRAVVRAHKGKVLITSVPGQGSSFTLRLRKGLTPRAATRPAGVNDGPEPAGSGAAQS